MLIDCLFDKMAKCCQFGNTEFIMECSGVIVTKAYNGSSPEIELLGVQPHPTAGHSARAPPLVFHHLGQSYRGSFLQQDML